MIVFTKQDQAAESHSSTALCTSARTGAGLDELRDFLRRTLFETAAIHGSTGASLRATPATAQRAAGSLATAQQALAGGA